MGWSWLGIVATAVTLSILTASVEDQEKRTMQADAAANSPPKATLAVSVKKGDGLVEDATVKVKQLGCKCSSCKDPVKCTCCPDQLTATTSVDGSAKVDLPPGTYDLRITGKAFEPVSRDGVSVKAGETMVTIQVKSKSNK